MILNKSEKRQTYTTVTFTSPLWCLFGTPIPVCETDDPIPCPLSRAFTGGGRQYYDTKGPKDFLSAYKNL